MRTLRELCLSEAERRRIVDDFLDDVLGGRDLDPALVARMRMARPELPDDPTPEQVEAWIELAQLVADPDFRDAVRAMSTAWEWFVTALRGGA